MNEDKPRADQSLIDQSLITSTYKIDLISNDPELEKVIKEMQDWAEASRETDQRIGRFKNE